ncbi:MAG TPA: EAL domain-containing protein [Desulfuromonadales bacterium]|nr:EAL domain-containing protein [Desulfuromonadales bacterium]
MDINTPPIAPDPQTGPRILIVDDDAAMLQSLSFLLGTKGYHADTAGSGTMALDRLETHGYEIILLDLQMPGMTGADVLRHVTKSDIETKVIVVSGEASFATAKETLKDGAYDFVRKPYDPGELLTTIGNALVRSSLERKAREMSLALEDSERLHRYIVNHSPDFVYVLDAEGRFTFVNDRAEDLLGYRRDELIGQHFSMLIYEEDLPQARYIFCERRTGKRATRDVELRLKVNREVQAVRFFDGYALPISLHSAGMYNPDGSTGLGDFLGTYGCARDITDRKRTEELINYQAYHDILTSLPNRALFHDRLQQALAQAKRYNHQLAVMYLDLDRFKLINDAFGHAAGDKVLRVTTERIRDCLRSEDTLARFGGDEFTLLLPQTNQHDNAAVVAEKIVTQLRAPIFLDDHEIFSSASIGIALFPEAGETPEALIKSADIAMYYVKSSGKDGHRFFMPEMSENYASHLALEQDLHRAVEMGQFAVFFQPKTDTRDGRIVGMEALLRWHHPEKGLLLPGEFIPCAEQTRLIVPIGEWILRATCREIRRWRDARLPSLKVAVNISVVQFEQDDFISKLLKTLEELELDGRCLEIEITEYSLVKNRENVMKTLKKLTSCGITVAIDDFGTGYSSLSYLQEFPVHTLKIDRSFVQRIDETGQETCLVDAIAAMALGLNLHLVAEGVETMAQLEYLKKCGCYEVQGFLCGRPASAEETFNLLRGLSDGVSTSCPLP